MAPAVGIISAVAGIVGAGVQFFGQQKAAAAQRRQNRIRQQQAKLEARRRRIAILRQMREKRAESAAAFGLAGAGFGSSGFAGAQGSISQSAQASITGFNQAEQLGGQQLAAQNAESRGNQIAGIGEGIATGLDNLYGSLTD